MMNDTAEHAAPDLTRRELAGSGAVVLAVVAGAAAVGPALGQTGVRAGEADPMRPVPLPQPVPVTEGIAELAGGARLWFWDTGGSGQAIVLVHPATGSGLIWGYQQPVLAKAGFRVVGYSRRGYYKSDPVDKAAPGIPSEDLKNLLDHLKIDRAHVVGSAAGCSVALDLAMSYPARVRSLVLAAGAFGTLAGKEKEYGAMTRSARVKGLAEMPPEFREIGPSYRTANPEGVKQWVELEHKALSGNRLGPTNRHEFTFAALKGVSAPVLLLAGGSDLMAPAPLHRLMARHLPNAEVQVVPESGHSIYWEQPAAFNEAVLAHVRRNAG